MEEAPAPTGDKERRDPDTCEDGSCEDTGHGKTRVMVRHVGKTDTRWAKRGEAIETPR